jgi:two-component system cell cycle sensor histidine kinase/response regulator CckA
VPVRALVIDDSDDDALLIVTHLRRGGIELTYERVETMRALAEALAARPPDIVLCDYNLPGFSAQDALRMLQDCGLDASFILVSGAVGEETAAAIMKAGAHDFILKDRLSRLVPVVERELRDAQVRRQRHGAEAALRDSEERFRLLAEHVQDIVFRYRLVPEPGFEYISPAVASLTGHQPAELYRNPALVFSPMEPEDRVAVEASWRSPEPSPLITRWRRPDGGIAWTEQRAVGIRDDSGQVIAVEGILRDVTSKVLADQEHARMDRELRQADRLDSLGRLAGGIAHDFNNVLAVIMAYAGEVISSVPDGHPAGPDALKIVQAAEHAAALTRQLLIFSRLEPSQPETLDLAGVVTGVEQLLRRTIGEDIEFLTLTQEDLYPVTIDRTKIEQVIMNLVMNSRGAMPDGGRLCIEAANLDRAPGLDQDDGLPSGSAGKRKLVSLTVTDTGSGMTPEVVQHAFEPFFTTKGPGHGTGLGLATVYGVVKEAGGDIRLQSKPGSGTTITVLLPASDQEITRAQVTRPAAADGAGRVILVVEDEDAVRDVVTRILTRARYQVIPAASGKDALEVITNSAVRIDAMLTDVVMPDMSGPQLTDRMRDARPQVPVLLMSGYTAGALPSGTVASGNLPLIRKPFSAETLLQYLQDALT